MPHAARTARTVLSHYATMFFSTLLFLAHAGFAQSLKFVSTIYNVPISNTLANGPNAVATDVAGALYILDTGHSRVWKVDRTQTVTLFAGNGLGAYTGDNGPAISAGFNSPVGIAVDLAGNVFIADSSNVAIRRIDGVTGIVTTIAGGNGPGYTGDNGPAKSAKFQYPSGIAVDPAGNIYVSDATSAVVRKISNNNTITTVVGGGSPASGNGDGGQAAAAKLTSPYGLALDASGNLYIADLGGHVVRKVATDSTISTFAGSTLGNSGMGGPATSAKLTNPRTVAVDSSGNVYIADGATNLVTVVDSNKNIDVLAGLGLFGSVGDGLPASEVMLNSPFGVAADPFGNVFIASKSLNAVYRVVQHPERFPQTKVGTSSPVQRLVLENTGTSTITTSLVAVTGDFSISPNLGLNASPCHPTTATTILTGSNNYCTLDVVFTPTASGLRSFPVTATSNDTPSTTVLTLTSTGMSSTVSTSGGEIFTVAGLYPGDQLNQGDNIPALAASLNGISGLTVDSAGNIIIAEYPYCLIRRVDAKTGIISTIVGTDYTACPFNSVVGPNGDGGPAKSAKIYLPAAIAYGPDKTLYISDAGHHQIRTIDPQGIMHTLAGNGLHNCDYTGDGGQAAVAGLCGPEGLAVDSGGNIIFAESGSNTIRKITPAGIISTIAGVAPGFVSGFSGDGGPAINAKLNNPWGLVVDSTDNIYFNDRANDVVRKIAAGTNIITTVVGRPNVQGYSGDGGPALGATISYAAGLAIDAAGNLYIADSQNNVVRRVDAATGIITTVAGNYAQGNLYNGDGIPATSAGLQYPETVAVDAAGYILVGDRNRLVRKVSPSGLLDFGDQNVNTTSNFQTLSISNIGNTPLHFDPVKPYGINGDFSFVSGGTCDFTQPLATGANCSVRILFTPTATYERYGTLAFNDDGVGSPQITQLRGNGLSPAVALATLSTAGVVFPDQVANTTSASQTIIVSNPGTSTLNISGISLVGANPTNFAQTSNCGATLPQGSSCNIVVTFTPSSVASFSATVMITDDATGSPQAATLSGNGILAAAPQAVLTPVGLTFAGQTVGTTSASQAFTLTNPGTATLNISGITIAGTDPDAFAQTTTCTATLAAGAHCAINVTFTPSSATTSSATINAVDNATGSPHTATLSGTGTAILTPQAVLNPSSLTFQSQIVGTTSAAQTLTLSNPGNATLNISGITLAGASPSVFAITPASTCSTTLAAGASCSIIVTFTPASATILGATVSIASNATGSPQTAILSGTGTAIPVAPDFNIAAATSIATVTGGSPAQYTINLASLVTANPFTGAVVLTTTGLPTGATATFSPATVTPGAAGASSGLTILTPHASASMLPGERGTSYSSKAGIISVAFLFFSFIGLRKHRRLPRLLVIFLALIAGGICATGMTGCGGTTPLVSQTYTITVTGTSGSVQHSTTVMLTVN